MANVGYNPKQQNIGAIPHITEQHLDTGHKSTNIPVSLFNVLPYGYPEGITMIGSKNPSVTGILGVGDIGLACAEADTDRASIHVYEDGFIEVIIASDGTHYVNQRGYVGTFKLSNNAVLHVRGHIGNLVASATSQVMLYKGSYVDSLKVTEGGYVRIYDGASIHNIQVKAGGRCMIDRGVGYNKLMGDKGALIARFMDKPEEPPRIKIQIKFDSEEDARKFCDETKRRFNAYGRITFDNMDLFGLNHCIIYDTFDRDVPCKDTVEFCAKKFTGALASDLYDSITETLDVQLAHVHIWVEGRPLAYQPKVVAQPEPKGLPRWYQEDSDKELKQTKIDYAKPLDGYACDCPNSDPPYRDGI